MRTKWQAIGPTLRWPAALILIAIAVLAVALTRPSPAPADERPPVAAPAASSDDYFLKLDGIEGESTDDKHARELDIESWSWGVAKDVGRPNFTDITFTTRTTKASPQLMLVAAQGKHIKTAVLTARKSGGDQQEFLKITLTDVLVTSFQQSGASGAATEQFSLSYAQIVQEYRLQNPDGSAGAPVRTGWDLARNRPI